LCADSPAAKGGAAAFGAFGVGCAECSETPVKNMTWGGLKRLFDGDPQSKADSTSH
jgi:hypothetical protein